MLALNSHPAGRHFLQIPGPSNVPDRVLRAIDRPTIDHRGPEFQQLGLAVLGSAWRFHPQAPAKPWQAHCPQMLAHLELRRAAGPPLPPLQPSCFVPRLTSVHGPVVLAKLCNTLKFFDLID